MVSPLALYPLAKDEPTKMAEMTRDDNNKCLPARVMYQGWTLGMCIEDGYPYRVLCSFYDSILEHYRAVPPTFSAILPKQAAVEI